MTRKEEIATKLSEDSCVIRTKAVYEYHMNAVEEDPTNRSVYGVVRRCAFSAIESFHVTEALPPDIMHDCLEGVFAMVLRIVLEALVDNNEVPLSLHDVNSELSNFGYGQNDVRNKPPNITRLMLRNGLSGKASEKWCLFRLLPMIIGNKVPVGDDDWKFYLICREMADYLMAPVYRKSWGAYLTNVIAEFIELFASYRDNIPCKVHYLIHYPRLMLMFGPLILLWCMRFEAKHQYFKKLAHVVCNFRNIALTLAGRHQQRQCWEHCTKRGLGRVTANSSKQIGFQSLPAGLQQALREKWHESNMYLSDRDELWICDELEKNSVKYVVEDCFVAEFVQAQDIPLFVQIKYLISFRKTWFLCGCIVLPGKFEEHMHAYRVKKPNDWLILLPGEEKDHHALDIYHNADTDVDYIPMRYKLTEY